MVSKSRLLGNFIFYCLTTTLGIEVETVDGVFRSRAILCVRTFDLLAKAFEMNFKQFNRPIPALYFYKKEITK